jgi:TolB-like protein
LNPTAGQTTVPANVKDPGRAVFLSYASQDAEAARHLRDALCAAGIEVWFDQSGLSGGDAWDALIRRQIKGCYLFVPMISANTQSRAEGYFRREWKLAVDRTNDMHDGRAFLLPVVIDGTSDAEALVPEKFREVQWTRLPAAAGTDAFVERVRLLLSPDTTTAAATSTRSSVPPSAASTVAASSRSTPPPSRRFVPWFVGILLVLVTGYLLADKFLGSKHALPPTNGFPTTEPPAGSPAQVEAPNDKSIAVLPFVDMSEKKDQAYFADGLAEELIDRLTKVSDLRVPARTSSFYFKDKQATIADIAKALVVAHVLEGSVRKSGNTIRITAQLVRADNGYHVWSETYDRQIDDIFKVQDDIAGSVVKALKVSLMGEDATRSPPRTNTDAYISYLQASDLFRRGSEADYRNAYEHLQHAIALDPGFAAAWSEMARVRVRQYYLHQVPLPAAAADAHRVIDRALALDPQLAEAHLTRGRVLFLLDWDWLAADAEMKTAIRLDPGIGECYRWAAMTAESLGRFDEAETLMRKALTLDPMEAFSYSILSDYLRDGGRWVEAAQAGARAHELMPSLFDESYLAQIALDRGDAQAALSALPRVSSPIAVASIKARALHALGRTADADAALADLEKLAAADAPGEVARVYTFLGDRDRAFQWLDRSYELRDPTITGIKGDRELDGLKGDPRYVEFLQKMKLPL